MEQTGEGTAEQGTQERPRKLTLSRETLRSLGDASLAGAAGGELEGETSKVCEFFFTYLTGKIVDALFQPPPYTEYGICTQMQCPASVDYTVGCHLASECSRYTPGCYSGGLE